MMRMPDALTTTDAELEELERAHLRQLGVPDGELEGAPGNSFVVRSLMARGLLQHNGDLFEQSPAGGLATAALDLRVGADAVLIAERTTCTAGETDTDERGTVETTTSATATTSAAPTAGPEQATRLLHLIPVGACCEDIFGDGFRSLELLASADEVADAVAWFLVPPDAAPGTGADLRLDASPDRLASWSASLNYPTVLAELGRVTPAGGVEDGDSYLIALGPGGCFAARTAAEAVEATAGRLVLSFTPIEPGWVRAQALQAARTVMPAQAGSSEGESPGTMAG